MLAFSNCDELEVVGYADFEFTGSLDDMKLLLAMYLNWLVESFHGRVSSRQLLSRPPCRQNLL